MTPTRTIIETLAIPDLDDDVDTLTAALAYAEHGWYVGWLNPRSKSPQSMGNGWPAKTSRDVKTIISWFAGSSGLGVFLHAGRSGAWIADVDHPEHMPSALAAAAETAVFQSTRDDQPGRGHYVFQCPPGRRLGNSTGQLGKQWGEARGVNGVIVVAPTVHPAGGRYQWVRTGPVPVLPESIAELLTDAAPSADAVTDADLDDFLRRHTAAARPRLLTVVLDKFAAALAAGGSRHDAAVSHMCWAMREAAAGYYPALDAATQLRDMYIDARTENRDGGRDATDTGTARAEFRGIAAWAVAQAETADTAAVRGSVDMRTTIDWAHTNGNGNSNGHAPAGDTSTMLLPGEFWAARPWLAHIRTAARSRALAPASVLGCVLARIAAFTPHTFTLPNPVGDPGSLNTYVAIVGPPGVGKSAGARTAAELVPPPASLDVAIDNLGSGEGLAELYCGEVKEQDADGKDRKVKRQVRWNAFVTLDEGGALTAFMQRQGNTTASYLRSAWTGDHLGQANATKETYRNVRNYRLGFIVGFQPELAGAVLADHLAGTPQRFLWLWAVDPTNPDTPPDWPGPLTLPTIPLNELRTHETRLGSYVRHQLTIDQTIADTLYTRHLAKIRGEVHIDPLDAHEPLHLLKTAALFAIADGRLHITTDDWQLATTLWATSCTVRTSVTAAITAEQARTEAISIDKHARREYAAEAARLSAGPAVERIARRIANWLHDRHDNDLQPDDGWPKRDLNQQIAGRDKHLLDTAIDHAIAQQWITETDGRYRPGESRPA